MYKITFISSQKIFRRHSKLNALTGNFSIMKTNESFTKFFFETKQLLYSLIETDDVFSGSYNS